MAKTPLDIRAEKVLAELQIHGMIPKPGFIQRMGDTAEAITDLIMSGPMSGREKFMDDSRRAMNANLESMAVHSRIIEAADLIAKKRGDKLTFKQGNIPSEGHVLVAMEYLERALMEHKAQSLPQHFRSMVVPKENHDKTKDSKQESKPTHGLGI